MSNYPAGVGPNHPHFNPPAEVACEGCDREVIPGDTCECGAYCMTEQERREDHEANEADRAYDMRFDR